MENISKKSLLIVFLFALFINNSYANDVINMNEENPKNKMEKSNQIANTQNIVEKSDNDTMLLFNNYIDVVNNQEFVKVISPYYDNIVFNVDNYNMTVYFNNSGIDRIEDGSSNDYDMYIKIEKEDIRYMVNNWYTMNTFDKLKYIVNLDLPLGEMVKMSGIAMSIINK